LMLRILIVEDFHILDLLPGLNGTVFLKLVLITFYLGITLNYAVLTGLFPKVIPQWSRNIVLLIGAISILFVIVTPLRIGSYSVPAVQLFSVIAGGILMGLTFKAALRHQKGAKTVLIGGIIALAFLLNDILFNNQIISTGNLSSWGVLIYLFLLIVVISRRFSAAMENEEGLNFRLQQLKAELEARVQERTQNIEAVKAQVEEEARSVKEANLELQKFKEDEQSLLRVMVHDLKSPFNKIKGIAQILRMNERYRGGEEEELNEMILKIAEEGRLLIDDLNVLTMYEAHLNDTDSYAVTCISGLLEDSVRSQAVYAKSKNIDVKYRYNHKVESYINPNMLSRIVDNLLSNAIKFSDKGGEVDVELIHRHNAYEIVVCDQGPGFTEEDRAKMYGKFQRLSARPTQGESSTGLGLNIVKNLTDLMGGTIRLESEPGEGSCFHLIFPIRHEEVSIKEQGTSSDDGGE
ncbi:MAG: sensor histidine kinase, partial [Cyclobacteriaceae bacterium]